MTLLAPASALLHKLTAGALASLLAVLTGLPVQQDIRSQQWHLDFLNIDQVHRVSTGEGVIVGVIDSGVDGDHPDLAGSLLPGRDLSFRERPDALEDLDGHGTAMAGLIAAHGQALGVAPDAIILPVRVSATGTADSSTHAAAIEWAVDNGATVLCLAFAHPNPSDLLERAIRYALDHDVVVVAAVGNRPDDEGLVYPVAYPGVVGAAGIDRDGNHAEVSVVSAAADLAAPAVKIMAPRTGSDFPTGYALATGTSDATAIIAGVAALIRAKYPDLSAEDVIHRMTATADDRGTPGRDDQYGHGIINPLAALTADIPPLNPPTTTQTASPPTEPAPLLTTAAIAVIAIVLILIVGALALTLRRR